MSDDANLQQVLADLELLAKRRNERRIDFFKPYDKQKKFFDLGAWKRERLLMAGNQQGKSECGAVEASYHLTGDYPADWKGRRWDRPIRMWIVGESGLVTRDVQQKKLCGPPGVDDDFGTGLIPKDKFVGKPSLARGVTDAYDTIQVRHKSGGISTATFKSYEQGRKKFQGEPVDIVWGDEEPPMDVYSEILARISATKGMVYITFTPLMGMSDVVIRFLQEPNEDRGVIVMTIEDALHIPVEERAKIIAGYPAHEREARARGVPMLGSGRIFQYGETSISEAAIEHIPPHWFKGWGIDFGIGHPFAAALMAWDKDVDCIHLLAALRFADQLPLQHAVPMKAIAAAVPVAWPMDGNQRDKGSGEILAAAYKTQGLTMMPEHATHADGSVSTEAGIVEMQDRMSTGRFKVAAHLSDWWEEYRLYHRKDGMIVKVRDDLLSATRIGIMMRRFWRQVPLGGKLLKRRGNTIAQGVDFDLFA